MNRKVIKYLLLSASCLGLFSCSESEYNPDESASLIARYLASSESYINFGANASSSNIQISTINTNWKIKNNSSWLTVSPDNGTSSASVLIASKENLSGDTARTQIILLNSTDMDWPYTCPISVTQSAASPYIIPDEINIKLPGRANTYSVHVSSNTDWHPSCEQSFIMVKRDGDNLVLQTDENNDIENDRCADVLLVGSTTTSLSVVQSPSNIKAESDTLYFDNIAASYILTVESDLPWSATTSYSWIQVSPSTGNVGISDLTISVSPNTTTNVREGSVYLKINGKSIKIPVSQRGYYAEVNTNCIEFGSHGGAMELSLSTNDIWKASLSDCDWLTITPKEGKNSTAIILNASDNATTMLRCTSMSIDASYSEGITVDIIQNGRFLRSSVESISFFGKGGNHEPVQIYSDAKYEITKNGDWFSLNETNNILCISAEVNTSGTWREGSIILTATDIKEGELILTIPVVQAVEGLTFSKESYKTDINYNLLNSYGLSISIISYNSDINYNESGITGIIKDKYNSSGDLNSGDSGGIEKNPYNDSDNTGNNINKDNYNSEINFDE